MPSCHSLPRGERKAPDRRPQTQVACYNSHCLKPETTPPALSTESEGALCKGHLYCISGIFVAFSRLVAERLCQTGGRHLPNGVAVVDGGAVGCLPQPTGANIVREPTPAATVAALSAAVRAGVVCCAARHGHRAAAAAACGDWQALPSLVRPVRRRPLHLHREHQRRHSASGGCPSGANPYSVEDVPGNPWE